MSPAFLSCEPMTMRSAFSVSWKAEPWRRNSGFMHRPKCLSHCFLDSFSRMGRTMFWVVPGTTVLLMTTAW